MKTAFNFSPGVVMVLAAVACSAPAAAAQDTVQASAKAPLQVCEAAVTQAIQKARGDAAKQVQFAPPKTDAAKAPAAGQPSEASINGAGHYQGVGGKIAFSYHCTVDPQGQEPPGVIFRELGVPSTTVEKPWKADLTNLSPEACEAAVASAVTDQYARAVNLVLSSTSRQLKPGPNNHTYMHGQGTAQKAAGMGPSAFTYRCELDTASGKFIGVQTDWLD